MRFVTAAGFIHLLVGYGVMFFRQSYIILYNVYLIRYERI